MLMEQYASANFSSEEDFLQNYKINVPENYNFAFDCVDVLASTKPDKDAIVWCNDKGEEARYSFSTVSAKSDAAARFFAAQGVKKGDSVMLIMKRRVQYWFAILGLIKLGAVAIPATHLLGAKDIIYRNNAASVVGIVTTEDDDLTQAVNEAMPLSPTVRFRAKVGAVQEGWLSFDDGLITYAQGDKPVRVTENDDKMLMYFTSGTTGMPKMVVHNHIYPLCHITTARFWQNLHPGSLHLTLADTGWAKAAWGKLFGQWLCEAAVFVYDHNFFNAGDMLRMMCKHKVTSFCAPPTVYRLMVKMDLSTYDLSSLEYVTTAGEPLYPEVFDKFYEQTGLRIFEAYGQTEMAPMSITSVYSTPIPGSIGKPSPAYRLLILDEEGNEVEEGETGEICLDVRPGKGVGVFMGYYKDSKKTNDAWRSGYYHTGDKARMDKDGKLWFASRVDDVIKSSGYRIGPFEVESVLIEHPAVMECAVIGVPDALRGQAIKASIILTKEYKNADIDMDKLKKELQQYVKDNTAAYKTPKIVDFVDSFPKTISGKIQRAELRKQSSKKKERLSKAYSSFVR